MSPQGGKKHCLRFSRPVVYYWQHGFLYSGGNFYTFDAPFGDVQVTTPWGMNNMGEIVGGYVDSQGMNYSFYLKAQ